MHYDTYNREERAACAHLFRLLHERLATDPARSPLGNVLTLIAEHLDFGGSKPELRADGAKVLTEVALVRDAYCYRRKPNAAPFMDALVDLVKQQEQVEEARLWSELPEPLNNPSKTHPKQIAHKGEQAGLLRDGELSVYGAVQGMFNAKPDLALVLPSCLVVFEAKLTERFDKEQLARTHNIAEVWSKLLYADLGFRAPPPFAVAKLGNESADVELSWQQIAKTARDTCPESDRTRIALEAAAALLD